MRGPPKDKPSLTYPPLNAPTGFRTGNGVTTSASLLDEVWKLLAVRRAADGVARAHIAGESIRDAILLDQRRGACVMILEWVWSARKDWWWKIRSSLVVLRKLFVVR